MLHIIFGREVAGEQNYVLDSRIFSGGIKTGMV